MTLCNRLFEGLDKRLDEKKNLETIAQELCPDVMDSRGKVMRLIKAHRGDEYLIDNASWLEYDIYHIRNPTGKSGKKGYKSKGWHSSTKTKTDKEYKLYLLGQLDIIEDVKEIIANQGEVSVERILEILEEKETEIKQKLSETEVEK